MNMKPKRKKINKKKRNIVIMETIKIQSRGNGINTLVTAMGKEIGVIQKLRILIEPNEQVFLWIDALLPTKYLWKNKRWIQIVKIKRFKLPITELTAEADLEGTDTPIEKMIRYNKHWGNSSIPMVEEKGCNQFK